MSTPVQNENGEWVIRGTRRPDGTWRRDVIVKEGYIPQEEVASFQTRASQAKPRGIPGLPVVSAPPLKASSQPRKSKNIASSLETLHIVEQQHALGPSAATDIVETITVTSANDPEKKLKALKKKLRQIEELELKLLEGHLVANSEQAEKLSKKVEILKEINNII